MKGIAKIAISVALIAIIVLSIIVASVAWFTSNPEVNANDVTLNAARTLNVTFDSTVEGTNYKYNGEIGNVASGLDAPYVYHGGSFTLRIEGLSADSKRGEVKVEFSTVTVTHPTGTVSDVLITDLFHITADVYQADENGGFVKVVLLKNDESDPTRSYFRAGNGAADSALPHYSKTVANLTIADNGILMNGANRALFNTGNYELSFTYTFLPEAAYQVWLAGNYSSVYGYELATSGDYVGVVGYTTYKAKYHYGLQRYTRSGAGAPYTYTENAEGEYVRVITSYASYASVTKYTGAAGEGEGAENGTYIKVGDSNDYILFNRYNRINGFPYSADKYRGETFGFTVACSVEEVDNEA